MNALHDIWKQQARRIDALTLRERVIMFISLAVALVGVTDALLLSPRMAEQKALATKLRQDKTEVDGLRQQLQGGVADNSPAGRLARDIERARAEQSSIDKEIAAQANAPTTQLPQLLERVLRRHDRLVLQRLVTLPAVAATTGSLPRQAVEIAMRGTYLDLARYVAETEAALPTLRWGDVTLTRQGDGAEMIARVTLTGAMP